ncbi:interleukin-6 receptor subunit beta [Spinachia spinachia]
MWQRSCERPPGFRVTRSGKRVRVAFPHAARSSLQFFIFGVILVHYPTPSHTGSCKTTDIQYQNCGIQPDGVHDLDCFRTHKARNPVCVWKPGRPWPGNNYTLYTLVVQQPLRRYCVAYRAVADLSKEVKVFAKVNVSVEVFEHGQSSHCTKAVFRGAPESFVRCASPDAVTFSRLSGRLLVEAGWPQEDAKVIGKFSVSYKAPGDRAWSEPVISQNATTCSVDNVNSSLVYSVRIRCVTSAKCPQCAASEAHAVPPELTTQPLIVDLRDTDVRARPGSRLLSLTWKFPARELHDGYHVTVGKASGEAPQQQITTSRPEVTLILSYSAYRLAISAVNNASTSPAVRRAIPQREDGRRAGDGKLSVTVHSNASFTVHWKDNLVKSYVCFSVEWTRKGHRAAYKSFYQNKHNYKSISGAEPLEAFRRYSIALHTRPNRDTCNMKRVNNSESTYGTTQFYYAQGPPVAAPNISSSRVTRDSAALQWSSIREEDARGFLLGYRIRCSEQRLPGGGSGTGGSEPPRLPRFDVTVDPTRSSFELRNLTSGTVYEVQISGFTAAGEGVRSPASLFRTTDEESSDLRGVIILFAVAAAVLLFGPVIMRRAKGIVWPSIPNPEKSNAMRDIDEPCALELLQSVTSLQVEEWDTASLRLVEKQHPTSSSAGEGDSDWIHRGAQDWETGVPHASTGGAMADVRSAPLAPSGGYTTLDVFQRATASRPEDAARRMDDVGQFSTKVESNSRCTQTPRLRPLNRHKSLW